MRKLLIVFLILLTPAFAFGATYYIDYAAGSDANNGTATGTPWKLCPGMVGFAGSYTHSPGDKFIFKGGVTWPSAAFPFEISYSGGDTGSPDVYSGGQLESSPWGTGYPVFDGEDASLYQNGFVKKAAGLNYITIDGLKVIRVGNITNGSGQGIFFGGGSGLVVKRCWLEPNAVNAFAISTTSGTYTGIYFHDNIIKKAGRVHFNLSGENTRVTDVKYYNNVHYGGADYNNFTYHCDGLMIGASGLDDYGLKDVYIYNNVWRGFWSKYATAQLYCNGLYYYEYNYTNGSHQPTMGQVLIGETSGIPGGKLYSPLTNTGGWTGEGTGTINASSDRFIVGERLFEGASYGGQYVCTVASAPTYRSRKSIERGYIFNNLFVSEHTTGGYISPASIDIALGTKDIHVYNNTVDQGYPTDFYRPTAMWILPVANGVTAKNNIFDGISTYGIAMGGTGVSNVTLDYNLYNTATGNNLILISGTSTHPDSIAEAQAFGWETHGLEGDPLFTTSPNGTIDSGVWSLQAESPAKGAGVDLSAMFSIYKDDVLVETWDMGAATPGYEIRLNPTINPYGNFDVTAVYVSGTLAGDLALTESGIVLGGKTLIGTVVGTTLVETFGADNAITTAFIAGITSDGTETNGWNNEVTITHADITRNSNTQFTIVLPAAAGYNITAAENISMAIPASVTASGEIITMNPPIRIDFEIPRDTTKVSITRGNDKAKAGKLGGPKAAELQGN